jgi:hypothetical protein
MRRLNIGKLNHHSDNLVKVGRANLQCNNLGLLFISAARLTPNVCNAGIDKKTVWRQNGFMQISRLLIESNAKVK